MITNTGEYSIVRPAPVSVRAKYNQAEAAATAFLARHSITILRISMGIVYVWFGALKAVHGLSPIEDFIRTALPFLPGDLFLPFLAVWEVVIGLGFISGRFTRVTVGLMLAQMMGAMSPLVLRPDLVFAHFPYGWTLVGQYIFKDIILVSASLVILTTARGGGLVSHKTALNQDRKTQ